MDPFIVGDALVAISTAPFQDSVAACMLVAKANIASRIELVTSTMPMAKLVLVVLVFYRFQRFC